MSADTIHLLQLIATTILTLCSIAIACVGCTIAYRQGYGFTPLVIVNRYGFFGGAGLTEHYGATVSIDVWNRRKYPIRIERVSFAFFELRFDELAKGFTKDEGWQISSTGVVSFHRPITLEPGGHHTFEMKAPFKRRSLDNLEDFVRISVDYFDPISNKYRSYVIVHRYAIGTLTGGVKDVKY